MTSNLKAHWILWVFVTRINRSGVNSFWPVHLSDCSSVRLFVCEIFYIGHIIWLVRVRAFIFHMSKPCEKTFLLVPSARSSAKVEYQGHNFQKKKEKKMAIAEAFVLDKHILFMVESLGKALLSQMPSTAPTGQT